MLVRKELCAMVAHTQIRQRSSRIKHFSAADSQFSLKYECVLIASMYTFQLAFQSDMEISCIQVVCYDTCAFQNLQDKV